MTTSPPASATPALPEPTPTQSEQYSLTHGKLTVGDYLPKASHDGKPGAGKCEWSSHVSVALTSDEIGALAWVLIDSVMKARFGPAVQLYDVWREHTLDGTTIPEPDRQTIGSFVKPVFGLPGADKKKSKDHLHGHIGEWLWHLLTKDNPTVRAQPAPKGDVTDSGGDGYTIYETANSELRFRLWESKKNTGKGSLSTSLNQAYGQLGEHGQTYVAKIVGAYAQASGEGAAELNSFITEIPRAWTQGDVIVGAGVTLATHRPLPNKPFKKMAGKLPLLDKPGQLRGLATSIECYEELADTVRRYAWTAL
ncbi:hypothetical protein OG801_26220 [Nocardioides sp. NBC_00163]|uniref:hypothetical protein n=1 Tax=Nocardioides sp. NBC_00163 TaxID=2975999 RepID=UPI003252C219